MKKLFILSISLILLFGFVSCDNATKEPTTNSNSTSIPGEITPPESSKLVDINDDQAKVIKAALNNYEFDKKQLEYSIHKEFIIKSDAKIDGKTVSGYLTLDMSMAKDKGQMNGEITFGDDVYKYNNLELSNVNDQSKTTIEAGSITKNGNKGSIKEAMEISSIIYGNKDIYSRYIDSSISVLKISPKSEEIDISGTWANYSSYDLEKDLKTNVIVVDAKVDGKTLQFKATISYNSTAEGQKPDNITIDYLGYDGVFFNEESIKKVFPNNPF